jgi:hypothetical protein
MSDIELTLKELEALKKHIEQRIGGLKEAEKLEKQGPVLSVKEIKPEAPVPLDSKPIVWL